MHRLIIVTGIPGSGKTTVLKKALEKVKKYNVVNYGTVMLKIGKNDGLINHRDEIRKLPVEKERDLQKKVAEIIRKTREMEDVIIDSHCTIKTKEGYIKGFPDHVLKKIKPDTFVLIEANPNELKKRRDLDESRMRDVESIEEIDKHQKKNREVAEEYKKISGAEIVIIKNRQGKVDEAANDLIKILE